MLYATTCTTVPCCNSFIVVIIVIVVVHSSQALLLSNNARRTSTVGEIVNLMSVDAQRLMDVVTYLHMLWSAPVQIVISLVFLYQTIGPSVFAGFVIMLLLIPVNAVIASVSRKFQASVIRSISMNNVHMIVDICIIVHVHVYYISTCVCCQCCV